jgi:uncharacterized protein
MKTNCLWKDDNMDSPNHLGHAATLTKLLSLLLVAVFLGACGNAQLNARKDLVKLGKDFTPGAFIACVFDDDKQAVRLFMDAGIDINAADKDGITAVSVAAMKGNAALVKALLDKGANPNVALTAGTEKGMTPLIAAATVGNLEVVKLLVGKGVDVNAKDGHGLTAADYAADPAKPGRAILDVLREHGAPMLTDAASAKLLDDFRTELKRKIGGTVGEPGTPDSWRQLISEQLANFKERHFTPDRLVQARIVAFESAWEILAIFKSGGLDESGDMVKRYMPFVKELQTEPEVQRSLLLEAARTGRAGLVQWLLDQHADVNAKDETGVTPLMWAALKGNSDVAQIILDAGADPNLKEESGMTTIMFAVTEHQPKILKLILAKKPDVSADRGGVTALRVARANNDLESVTLLKEAGAKE